MPFSVVRLVGADDVDAGQALDGRQLVDQALPLTEADDADGEGDRRHQHQALGDHRHQGRHHAEDAGLDRLPREGPVTGDEQLVDDREDAGRDQQPRDDLQDLVDAVAQLGIDEGELRCFGRQLQA